jgi:hypothetical protein
MEFFCHLITKIHLVPEYKKTESLHSKISAFEVCGHGVKNSLEQSVMNICVIVDFLGTTVVFAYCRLSGYPIHVKIGTFCS